MLETTGPYIQELILYVAGGDKGWFHGVRPTKPGANTWIRLAGFMFTSYAPYDPTKELEPIKASAAQRASAWPYETAYDHVKRVRA
jgi:hypothetical protein